VFSVATAYAPDPTIVSIAGVDRLQVRDAGIYSISVTLAFTAVVTGVSWMNITPDYVVPIGSGLQVAGASLANVKLAAGAVVQPLLAHGSAGDRTFTSRVRITRVG
jgi:hypothetical protein